MDRTLVRVKQYVFDHFHNIKCSCCTEDETSRLVIHHLSYTRDSVKYTSFANNTTGRIQYYATLCNEVELNPNNLRIMCMDCHSELEGFIREVKNNELGTFTEVQERVPEHLLDMFMLTLKKQGILDEVY